MHPGVHNSAVHPQVGGKAKTRMRRCRHEQKIDLFGIKIDIAVTGQYAGPGVKHEGLAGGNSGLDIKLDCGTFDLINIFGTLYIRISKGNTSASYYNSSKDKLTCPRYLPLTQPVLICRAFDERFEIEDLFTL